MSIIQLSTDEDFAAYDQWLRKQTQGTVWQSLAWKRYQEALGREVRIYGIDNEPSLAKATGGRQLTIENDNRFLACALVVIDRTIGGLSTWEIPRGPLWQQEGALLNLLMERIVGDARQDRCIQLLYSPTFTIDGWTTPLARDSKRHVHPEATLLIDLKQSEQELLAQMHQKGRYNINVARKHGVEIVQGTAHDIDDFYRLLIGTGNRDNFIILKKSQYRCFLESLEDAMLLLAKRDGTVIAGLLNAMWNGTMYYYYGASSYEHRQLMAPYLLQWEAMMHAKRRGCSTYDLLGIMPPNAPENDPWKGITDFKRKFGGSLVLFPKERICIFRPIIKLLFELKRKAGMRGRMTGSLQ